MKRLDRSGSRRIERAALWALIFALRPLVLQRLRASVQLRLEGTK